MSGMHTKIILRSIKIVFVHKLGREHEMTQIIKVREENKQHCSCCRLMNSAFYDFVIDFQVRGEEKKCNEKFKFRRVICTMPGFWVKKD